MLSSNGEDIPSGGKVDLSTLSFIFWFVSVTIFPELLNEYFGDLGVLYSEGLIAQFKKLKQKVNEHTLIGLILAGVNNTTLINRYIQQDTVTTLDLTISSICRTLIREHFTEQEIINLCVSTPNFQIYYIKEHEELT